MTNKTDRFRLSGKIFKIFLSITLVLTMMPGLSEADLAFGDEGVFSLFGNQNSNNNNDSAAQSDDNAEENNGESPDSESDENIPEQGSEDSNENNSTNQDSDLNNNVSEDEEESTNTENNSSIPEITTPRVRQYAAARSVADKVIYWSPTEDDVVEDGEVVATKGNDANDGEDPDTPFLTWEKVEEVIKAQDFSIDVYVCTAITIGLKTKDNTKDIVPDNWSINGKIGGMISRSVTLKAYGAANTIINIEKGKSVTLQNVALDPSEGSAQSSIIIDGGSDHVAAGELILGDGVEISSRIIWNMDENGGSLLTGTGQTGKELVKPIKLIGSPSTVIRPELMFNGIYKQTIYQGGVKAVVSSVASETDVTRYFTLSQGNINNGYALRTTPNGDGKTLELYKIITYMGVYLNPETGEDTNDGSSDMTAVKTVSRAIEIVNNTAFDSSLSRISIYICSPIEISDTQNINFDGITDQTKRNKAEFRVCTNANETDTGHKEVKSLFVVKNGGNLSLGNMTARFDQRFTDDRNTNTSIVSVEAGGTLNVGEGAILTGRTATSTTVGTGVGVEVYGDATNTTTFNMTGGEISYRSKGVYISGSTDDPTKTVFNLQGGNIQYNSNTNSNNSYKNKSGTYNTTGGGVYVYASTFNFSNGSVNNNIANARNSNTSTYSYGYGCGIYLGSSAAFDMSGGSVSSNSTSSSWGNSSYNNSYGGGIYVTGDIVSFNMSGGEISDNNLNNVYVYTSTSKQSSYGGGIYFYNSSNPGHSVSFRISGGKIYKNKAKGLGTGLYVYTSNSNQTNVVTTDISSDTNPFTIDSNSYSDSSYSRDNSALYVYSDGSSRVRLENFTVSNNTSNSSSTPSVGAYIKTGSNALSKAENYTFNNLTFKNNSSSGSSSVFGGGLRLDASLDTSSTAGKRKLRLTNCTFEGNSGANYGGGLAVFSNYANVEIDNCTFKKNSSRTSGGGLYTSGNQSGYRSAVIINKNNTFESNTCSTDNGGDQIRTSNGVTFLLGGKFTSTRTKADVSFSQASYNYGFYVSPNNIESSRPLTHYVPNNYSRIYCLDKPVTKNYSISTYPSMAAGVSVVLPCGTLKWNMVDADALSFECDDVSAYDAFFQGGTIPENTILQGDGKNVVLMSTLEGGGGVFLDGKNGNDTGSGNSPASAVKTLDKAKEILKNKISEAVAKNTYTLPIIYICGTVTISSDYTISLDPTQFAQSTKAYDALPERETALPSSDFFYPVIRRHQSYVDDEYLFKIGASATVNFENVYIDGDKSNVVGRGIYVDTAATNSTLNLKSGTRIVNCYSYGIYCDAYTTINMTGNSFVGYNEASQIQLNSGSGSSRSAVNMSEESLIGVIDAARTNCYGIYFNVATDIAMTEKSRIYAKYKSSYTPYSIYSNYEQSTITIGSETDTEDSHPSIDLNGSSLCGIGIQKTPKIEFKGYAKIQQVAEKISSQTTYGILFNSATTNTNTISFSGHSGLLNMYYGMYFYSDRQIQNITFKFKDNSYIAYDDSWTYEYQYGIYFGGSNTAVGANKFEFSDNAYLKSYREGIHIHSDSISYTSYNHGNNSFTFTDNSFIESKRAAFYDANGAKSTITLSNNAYFKRIDGNITGTGNDLSTVYLGSGETAYTRPSYGYGPSTLTLNGNSKIINESNNQCAIRSYFNKANYSFAHKINLNDTSSVSTASTSQPAIDLSSERQAGSVVTVKENASVLGGNYGISSKSANNIDISSDIENGLYLQENGLINLSDNLSAGITEGKIKVSYNDTKINTVLAKPSTNVTSAVDWKSAFEFVDYPVDLPPIAGTGDESTYLVVKGEVAVYMSGNGLDTNTGLSAATPVQSFKKAKEVLKTMPADTDIFVVGAGVDFGTTGEKVMEFDEGGTFTNDKGETWIPKIRRARSYTGNIFYSSTNYAKPTFKNLTFYCNDDGSDRATTSNLIYYNGYSGDTMTFENCNFSNNKYSSTSSLIYMAVGKVILKNVKCNNSEFNWTEGSNNSRNSLFCYSATGISAENCEFNNNKFNANFKNVTTNISLWGAFFYNNTGDFNIDSTTFEGNVVNEENVQYANFGGLIYNNGNNVGSLINKLSLIDNKVTNYNASGTPLIYLNYFNGKITNSNLNNNVCNGISYGILRIANSSSVVDLSNVNITGNTVKYYPLYISGGDVTLTSINLSSNKSVDNASAVDLYTSSNTPLKINGGRAKIERDIYLSSTSGNIVLTRSLYQKNFKFNVQTSSNYGRGNVVVKPDGKNIVSAAQYFKYFDIKPYDGYSAYSFEADTQGNNIVLKRRVFIDGVNGKTNSQGSTPAIANASSNDHYAVKTLARALTVAKSSNTNCQYIIFYVSNKVLTNDTPTFDLESSRVDGELSSEVRRYTGFSVKNNTYDAYWGDMFDLNSNFTMNSVNVNGECSDNQTAGAVVKNSLGYTLTLSGDTKLTNNRKNDESKASMISSTATSSKVILAGNAQVQGTSGEVSIYNNAESLTLNGNVYITGIIELEGSDADKQNCRFVTIGTDFSSYNNSIINLQVNGLFSGREVLKYADESHQISKEDLALFSLDRNAASSFTLNNKTGQPYVAELQDKLVVYLNPNGGSDSKDGLTADNAKQTLAGAYDAMKAQEATRGKGGGIVYVMGQVNIADDTTIRNLAASGASQEVSYLQVGSADAKSTYGFVSFRRYSQPTNHAQLTGFSKPTYKGIMFNVNTGKKLTLNNSVDVEGHGEAISASESTTAPGVVATSPMIVVNNAANLTVESVKFGYAKSSNNSHAAIQFVDSAYNSSSSTISNSTFTGMGYDGDLPDTVGVIGLNKKTVSLNSCTFADSEIPSVYCDGISTSSTDGGLNLSGSNSIAGQIVLNDSNSFIKLPSSGARNTIDGETSTYKIKVNNPGKGRKIAYYNSTDAPNRDLFGIYTLDDETFENYNVIRSTTNAKEIILDHKQPVFLNGQTGDDTATGLTPATAVKTLKQAYTRASENNAGYIVVSGKVTLTTDSESIRITSNSYSESGSDKITSLYRPIEIMRYSKPTTSIAGFEAEAYKDVMFELVNGSLEVEDLQISGHSYAINSNTNTSPSMVSPLVSSNTPAFTVDADSSLSLNVGAQLIENNNTGSVTQGGVIYNSGSVDVGAATVEGQAGKGASIYHAGTSLVVSEPDECKIQGRIFLASTEVDDGLKNSYITISKKMEKNQTIYVEGDHLVRDKQIALLAYENPDSATVANYFQFAQNVLPKNLKITEKYNTTGNLSLEDYSDITITKTWKKTNNYTGTHPESMTLKLSNNSSSGDNVDFTANVSVPASGDATVNHGNVTKSTVSGEDVWTIVLKDMPTYESKGTSANKITYKLEETQVGGEAIATAKWRAATSAATSAGTHTVANTKQFTLTYNKNGRDVTGSAKAAETVDYGTKLTCDAGTALSKTGYTLIGWNTKEDGTGTHYNKGSEIVINEDITLYAMWAKITVDFAEGANLGKAIARGQNATINVTVDSPEASTVLKNFTLKVNLTNNVSYVADSAKPTGATYSSSNTTLTWTNPTLVKGSNSFSLTVKGKEDISLNDIDSITFAANANFANDTATIVNGSAALPVIDAFKITYDKNGATTGESPVDSKYYWQFNDTTKTATVLGNSAMKKVDGNKTYTFVGWNTSNAGTGTHYNAADTIDMVAQNKDLTLYAQWGNAEFDVTLEQNKSKVRRGETITYKLKVDLPEGSDTSIPLAVSVPVPANTTFVSADKGGANNSGTITWSITNATIGENVITFVVKVNTNKEVNEAGNILANATVTHKKSNKITVSNTIPITRSFIITYDKNGATSGNVPTDATYYSPEFKDAPQAADNTGNMTKADCVFAGWNTKSDGTGTHYAVADKIAISDSSSQNDVVLYASWAKISVTARVGDGLPKARRGSGITYTVTYVPADTASVTIKLPVNDPGKYSSGTTGVTYDASSKNVTCVGDGKAGQSMSFTYIVLLSEDTSTNTFDSIKTKPTVTFGNTAIVGEEVTTNITDSFTVTYNGNGSTSGAVPTDSKYYAPEFKDKVVVKDRNTLATQSKVFVGWNTVSGGTGTHYNVNDQIDTSTWTDNVVLYAQWASIQLDQSFGLSGTKVRRGEEITYTLKVTLPEASDSTAPLQIAAPIPMNTSFVSADKGGTLGGNTITWTINNATAGLNTFIFKVKVDEVYGVNNATSINANATITYKKSNTISASNKATVTRSFKITYDKNGAVSGTVPVDAKYYSPEFNEIPTVLGNVGNLTNGDAIFGGWNTSANGTGTHYAANGSKITTLQDSAAQKDVTLYATWPKVNVVGAVDDGLSKARRGSEITYTVTYTPADTASTTITLPVTDPGSYKNGSATGGATYNASTKQISLTKSAVAGQAITFKYIVKLSEDTSTNNYENIKTKPTVTFAGTSFTGEETTINITDSFTVTYDGNGADSGTAPKDAKYYAPEYNDQATAEDKGDLVKEESTFVGWNTKADGTGTRYNAGDKFVPSVNTTLFAQYIHASMHSKGALNKSGIRRGEEVTYTISIDLPEDTNQLTISVPVDSNMTFVECTPTTGSFDSSTKTLKWNKVSGKKGENVFTFKTKLTTDISLNALNSIDENATITYSTTTFNVEDTISVLESYAVTYDGNGNTAGEVPQDLTYYAPSLGEQFTIANSGNLEKTGYGFNNWNSAADGSGDTYKAGEKIYLNDDLTLLANWKANIYIIAFNKGDEEATGEMSSISATYDKPVTLPKNAFEKDLFAFVGWSLTSPEESAEVKFIDSQTVENLTTQNGEMVTLYAVWSDDYSTISFNTNGGSAIDDINVANGNKLIAPSNPTKTGYTFGGWCTDAETSQAYDFTTAVSESFTLYAKWTPNTYTVHFDGQGSDSGTMADEAFTYDVAKKLPVNTFGRTNYTFKGWKLDGDVSDKVYYDGEEVVNLGADNDATITLNAVWEAGEYKVAFNANQGTGEMNSQTFKYGESQKLAKNKFTRTDYAFVGWSTNASDTAAKYCDEKEVLNLGNANSTVTLYAIWSNNFATIKFDTQGGSAISDLRVAKNTAAPAPNDPYKTGYNFKGWTLNGNEFDFSQTIDNDITLKAKWEAAKYTITFDRNGGTYGKMDSIEAIYNQESTLPKNVFGRQGYVFDGWTLNSDGTGKIYKDGDKVKNLGNNEGQNVVLFAKWSQIAYKVHFDKNEGTGNMADQSFVYDGAQTLNLNKFEREGYAFVGWNTKTNGSGTSYSNGEMVKNLTEDKGATVTLYAMWSSDFVTVSFDTDGGTAVSPVNVARGGTLKQPENSVKRGHTLVYWEDENGSKFDFATQIDNDITLKAKWIANNYIVHFDGNGSDAGALSDMSFTYGIAQGLTKNTLTRIGYSFKGWNSAADGSGKAYKDEASVKNLSENNGEIVNLYAQWAPCDYTVIFDGNGAEAGVMNTQGFVYDTPQGLIANTFTRKGYGFVGWNTEKDGSGTTYIDGHMVQNLGSTQDEEVTLYAMWSEDGNYITVTFNSNGGSDVLKQNVVKGNKAVRPTDPEFTGHKFTGWFKDDAEFDFNSELNEDITLNAHWENATYKVKFDGNGATSGRMDLQEFSVGTAQELSENQFTRTGYAFNGWNTRSDGTGEMFANKDEVLDLTENNGEVVTLFAQWKSNAYTIKFDSNGGIGEMDDMAVNYDSTVSLPLNQFTRTGFKFASWNTKSDGTGDSYIDGRKVLNLIDQNEGTITLYATWIDANNSATVTFDSNGGSEVAPQNVTKGEKVERPDDPTLAGYTFIGWYNGDVEFDFSSPVNSDITLSAKWIANTYTVHFDGNGATGGDMLDQYMTYDVDYVLTKNAFTREDASFIGWNTAADGSGNIIEDESEIANLSDVQNDVVNLYAMWISSNVEVESEFGLDKVRRGEKLTYKINVNLPTAKDRMPATTVKFAVPENTNFVEGSQNENGVYDALSRTITWNFGNEIVTFALEDDATDDKTIQFRFVAQIAEDLGINDVKSINANSVVQVGDVTFESEVVSSLITESYAVTYNANGAEGNVPDVTRYYSEEYNDSVIILGNDGQPPLTKKNAQFTYWDTESDGSGQHLEAGNEIGVPGQDMTLYAQFKDDPDLLALRATALSRTGDVNGTMIASFMLLIALAGTLIAIREKRRRKQIR